MLKSVACPSWSSTTGSSLKQISALVSPGAESYGRSAVISAVRHRSDGVTPASRVVDTSRVLVDAVPCTKSKSQSQVRVKPVAAAKVSVEGVAVGVPIPLSSFNRTFPP